MEVRLIAQRAQKRNLINTISLYGRFTKKENLRKNMDKMGIISVIMGLVLCAIGGLAIWTFLPEVIIAVKGLIGIVVVLAGLLLLIFGLLIVND
jgi:hypothetical protein